MAGLGEIKGNFPNDYLYLPLCGAFVELQWELLDGLNLSYLP